MTRKIVWVVVSCLMILSLVLASCAPAVTEEEEVVTPTEKEKEVVTPTEKEKEVVPAGPEMVKLSLKKVDGTVVEKMVEKPKYGGTLSSLIIAEPAGFDPIASQSNVINITSLVYEKLQGGDIRRGLGGTGEYDFTHFFYVPPQYRLGLIAESWEQPDPLTLVWHIRKGIYFQNVPPVNGRELTAEDVAYSFNRGAKPPSRIADKYWGMISSITATDKYTVVEKYKYVDYDHVEMTGDGNVCEIYAKECVAKYGNLNTWESCIGTGPWIMTNYIRASVTTFKRNPNYWRNDPLHPENQLPYADNVKILFIPDQSTQMAALRSGKIDCIFENATYGGYTWIEADSLAKTNPDIGQYSYLSPAGGLGIRPRVDEPPFDNLLVRQAMLLCVPEEEVLRDYYRGKGEMHQMPHMRTYGLAVYTPYDQLPTTPQIPGSRCSVKELFGQNLEKAKQLLTEAGYPNGFTFTCYCTQDEVDRSALCAAYLAKGGIKMEIKVVDPGVESKMQRDIPRIYHGALMQGSRASSPLGTWTSVYTTAGSMNLGNISDKHIDEVFLKMVAEPDAAKRDKMNKDLAIYALEQAYHLTGPHPYSYNFWQPWVKNCEGMNFMSPWGNFEIFNYAWVDQDLKEEKTGRR